MSIQKQYAERDVHQLDELGNYFSRHMLALTAEDLYSKSDIAAELAWRDAEIERLRTELSELRTKAEAQAVPVALRYQRNDEIWTHAYYSQAFCEYLSKKGIRYELLYTAPPAQAASLTTPTPSVSCVPDEKPNPDWRTTNPTDYPFEMAYIKGWNECRAVMLAAAPSPTGLDNPEAPKP